ncbi:MAG: hypothetical protein GAK28_02416 [Luteibacter sp.]|uniref:hypothetical protein n=1 Tax=Luteibacter sp. TaxID=1886636 RepID=UPI00137F4983|nr:hypothetical protein [Luteibacter sp.]KAF1006740.1 MAG: hypothetical protein GAK28_02416 [Luteibacter sp.]
MTDKTSTAPVMSWTSRTALPRVNPAQMVRIAKNYARVDQQHSYTQVDDFMPHDWVVAAMCTAYDAGRQNIIDGTHTDGFTPEAIESVRRIFAPTPDVVGGDVVGWHAPDEIPATKPNDRDFFQIAVRRKRSDKVFSFPAVYCNSLALTVEYDPEESSGNRWSSHFLSEELADEGEMGFTGWWDIKSNSEYDTYYEPALEDGDELIGWCELPQWGAAPRVQGDADHNFVSRQVGLAWAELQPDMTEREQRARGHLDAALSALSAQPKGEAESQWRVDVIRAMDEIEPQWRDIGAAASIRALGLRCAKRITIRSEDDSSPANAVAYLDIGVGGYVDVGSDLSDDQLAELPMGRHMLGIIGTFGVNGFAEAHPAEQTRGDGVVEAMISAAISLINGAEECETADGLMNAAQLHLWHALEDAIEKVGPAEISDFAPRQAVPDGVHNRRLMQASGFGSLLAEVLGSSAQLSSDLRERVRHAVEDNEDYLAQVLAAPSAGRMGVDQ